MEHGMHIISYVVREALNEVHEALARLEYKYAIVE